VRIGQHDGVVLRAHHALHALAGLAGTVVDVGTDLGRANEGHRLDIRMVADRVHHVRPAVHHVEHTRRHAGFQRQFAQAHGDHRVLLGWLEDEGIAGGDGHGEHPQRDHRREVERGNAGADAQRLQQGIGIDARGDVVRQLAELQVADTGGVLDHFQAAEHVALGIGQGLALFGSEDRRQLLHVLADQLLVLEEDARTRTDRCLAPGLEGFLAASDGTVDFLGSRKRHARQDFLGRRVDDIAPVLGRRFDKFTVDQQFNGRNGAGRCHKALRLKRHCCCHGSRTAAISCTECSNAKNHITMRSTAESLCINAQELMEASTMDWDNLRYFLEVARAGRLTTAARRLAVDHTTVSRRLQALEKSMGLQLFLREPGGYKLTEAGRNLLPRVEAMESASVAIEHSLPSMADGLSGQVRIGATEGYGTVMLAGQLTGLSRRYPHLNIDLLALPRAVRLSRHEADIVITLERPERGPFIITRLTDYVLRLYASPAYLDEHPPIRSREDLAAHRFVSYVDDLLFSKELLFLDGIADARSIGLRSTSLLAQQEAVAMGAGIAILPAFSADADPRLRLLLPEEVSFTRTFWMLMPIEFKDLARMRTTWDYLKEMAQQNQGRLLGQ